MKTSVTLVFSLLFVVVAIVFYFSAPNEKDIEQVQAVAKSMTLLDLEQDDEVDWIQIQNLVDKESITLEFENNVWMIKYPIVSQADGFMAKGLVTALTASKKARRLEREGPWEDYGLLRPDIKIGVESKRGMKRKYLILGDPSPIGNFIFARWEGEEEYFLLDSNIKKAFNRSVYSLRLKQIFPVSIQEVSKIRFRTKREEYELARHDDRWFWMEPIPILGEVIDNQKMDTVLAKVRDLYIKDFLDAETRGERKLGFSLLGQSIRVWPKDAEKPMILYFGDEVEARDAFYGRLEGDESFFLVAKSNVEALFQAIESLAEEFENKKTPLPS